MSYDIQTVKAANPLSAVIAELTGQTPRRVGAEHRFQCVFHSPDRNPSLDANDEKDGGVYKCRSCGAQGDVLTFVQQHKRLDLRGALEFLADRGHLWPESRGHETPRPAPAAPSRRPSRIRPDEIEREHLYRRDGVVVARHLLLKKRAANGKKIMPWERPDGAGGWLIGLDDVHPGLFGLEDAIALKGSNGGLIVCEGEKDAAAVLALGLPAVSSPHGAGKWDPAYAEAIVAAGFTRPYVFGDHDLAGRGHNETVTRELQAAGLGESRPVPWEPDRPEGFDVADFLAAHPRDGKALLIKRCQHAPTWIEAGISPNEASDSPAGDDTVVVCLADVQPEQVQWVWRGCLARRKLTMLAGNPGQGKSYLTADLVARVTTGCPMPGESTPALQGNVIVLAAEDGVADTIRPRLDACGGDPTRVHLMHAIKVGKGAERAVSLDVDLPRLERLISRLNAVMVVIDPVSSYLGPVKSGDDIEVRRVLTPLAALAERTGVVMLGLMHLNKNSKAEALHRGMSSMAFIAVPRIVLAVGPDPDEADPNATGGQRILASLKQNIAPPITPLAYAVVDEGAWGRFEWRERRQGVSVEDLFRPSGVASRGDGDVASATADAFVAEYLREGRERESSALNAAAKDAGIKWRHLQESRKRLCEKPRREGFGPGATWWVRLKPEAQSDVRPRAAEPALADSQMEAFEL
jgi:hypothetical protein